MRRELIFLLALWKANLLAAMEYRVPFISQIIGMMLNNAIYFIFWVIFFDRFKEIRGWDLTEMFLLFGIVATGFGLGVYLFGNVVQLTEVITSGRLDYYLSLPRPVLLHVLASSSIPSGLGDLLYGLLSFGLAGQYTPGAIFRFGLGSLLAMVVLLSFLILVQSLAFWLGNTALLSQHADNAILTFSLYPITLFDGTAKFILFTLIPAAFVGAVPAEFVRTFNWVTLAQLLGGALVFLGLAILAFQQGLRRYESGSAIQIQV
jgi:ABC-2 type transport system permease protein